MALKIIKIQREIQIPVLNRNLINNIEINK
jgi:hypothetical protein